jgi:hypothetical protein
MTITQCNPNRKENAMKRGHVYGTRKVTRKAQAWYDAIAEAHIARIERELAEKQQEQSK